MFDTEVKNRLSLAFASTNDIITLCQNLVTSSSVLSTIKKTEILQDLADIKNIIKRHNYDDIDAIEEAIIALNERVFVFLFIFC